MERLDSSSDCYRSAIQHVYGLAHNVSNDKAEQDSIFYRMQEIERQCIEEGTSGLETVKELLSVILDGLSYGNWPWIVNGVNTLK